mmetsp:Transcript_86951/g.241122  ORF Transcript_86951/g.241122 Transcript_86951/m.241122 type:complete len:298 (-) Transcript_86951:168-1061(-)
MALSCFSLFSASSALCSFVTRSSSFPSHVLCCNSASACSFSTDMPSSPTSWPDFSLWHVPAGLVGTAEETIPYTERKAAIGSCSACAVSPTLVCCCPGSGCKVSAAWWHGDAAGNSLLETMTPGHFGLHAACPRYRRLQKPHENVLPMLWLMEEVLPFSFLEAPESPVRGAMGRGSHGNPKATGKPSGTGGANKGGGGRAISMNSDAVSACKSFGAIGIGGGADGGALAMGGGLFGGLQGGAGRGLRGSSDSGGTGAGAPMTAASVVPGGLAVELTCGLCGLCGVSGCSIGGSEDGG